ncbi:MAG: hypothetical protein HY927_03560 [Elusimicrobia bacterium]|nr:hypothetical protein [Elusimicrobiota bacterium]
MNKAISLSAVLAVSAVLLLSAGEAGAEKPGKGPGAKARAEGGPDREKGQKPGKHEQFIEKLSERLAEALELTAEQQDKVKGTVDKSKPRLESLHREMQSIQEKMRKEMFAMKEGIRENLTMDQKERFDEIIMKLMARGMGQGGGGGRMGMRGGRQGMMDGPGGMRQRGRGGMPPQEFGPGMEGGEGGDEPGMMPPPPDGPGPDEDDRR